MRILVTGGAGLLGSHLQKTLLERGHQVYAPTRATLDLTNQVATKTYLKNIKPEAVVHCAAVVGGIQANISGGYYFLTQNIQIDHSVIFSALEENIENFLYIGSSCMYPANRNEPLKESDLLSGPLEPTNANYALAKIVGSKLVSEIDSNPNLNWKTFIASNLYGPGDHFEEERSHLIAAIIKKAFEAKKLNLSEIEMWGDGTNRREFTYVADFSNWIGDAISKLNKFPNLLNIGAGIDYTVVEFYEMVLKSVDLRCEIIPNLTKPQGNIRKLMDSSIALNLGWNPSTSAQLGIDQTVSWYRENINA